MISEKPTIKSKKHQRKGQSANEGAGECNGVWVALPTDQPGNPRREAQARGDLLMRRLNLRPNESAREFRQ